MTGSRRNKTRPQARQNSNNNLLDTYSPLKVGKIIPTNTKKKENTIEYYRPKAGECLDYNISEAFINMDVGDTKINVKQIEASYVPAPVDDNTVKKRKKTVHEDFLTYKFVDEIWREQQEALQEKYKKEFKQFVKNRKLRDRKHGEYFHGLLMALTAPVWYQELSPNQLKTVERLQYCILFDYQNNTIINTQENIGYLGLVLRPNHRHIEKALQLCCGDPVQFLLILYQLIEPKRKSYSINDRLLLSAVVHLTMRETLRELHVRIPSPPKFNVKNVPVKKMPKKRRYKSPYLVPYKFKPEPKKYSGIYENKHIQYPESPYFSYVADMNLPTFFFTNTRIYYMALKIVNQKIYIREVGEVHTSGVNVVNFALIKRRDMEFAEDISTIDLTDLDPIDKDVIQETKIAQSIYNSAFNTNVVFLKPTVKKENIYTLDETNKTRSLQLPSLAELNDKELECVCGEPVPELGTYFIHHSRRCAIQLRAKHQGTSLEVERVEVFCKIVDYNSPLCPDVIQFVFYCECMEKARNFLSYLCEKCIQESQHKNVRNVIGGVKLTEDNIPVPILLGTYVEKTCDCLKNYKNKLASLMARNRIKCQSVKYVLGGVVNTKFGPVYIIQYSLRNKLIKKLLKGQDIKTDTKEKYLNVKEVQDNEDDYTEKEQTGSLSESKLCVCERDDEWKCTKVDEQNSSENSQTDDCQCKMELDKFMKNQCYCEQCNVEQRRLNATYINTGLMETQDGQTISVVSGVQELRCNCLSNYIDKLNKLEEYKQRIGARHKLISQIQKYAIGGVVNTPDGPQYVVTGVRPPVQCECARVQQEKRELEEALKRMPKMPPTGRIKYGITGVKQQEEDNVYIVSQALAIEACECEKLYNAFTAEHRSCLEQYEKYLETICEEVERDSSSADKNSTTDSSGQTGRFETNISDESYNNTQADEEYNDGIKVTTTDSTYINSPISNTDDHSSREDDETSSCSCEESSSDSLSYDDRYAIKLTTTPTPVLRKDDTNDIQKLKRFVILDKITCEYSKMKQIIKRVLHGMAEDGFPLAKLPDVYKLPHIKLWIQLRCGKKWTQKDRAKYLNFSYQAWEHTDICYKDVHVPDLGISKESANRLTWKDYEFSRRTVGEKVENFHRAVKKQRIDGAREFYPTTFAYQFPTATFRDCYFAYLPSKEEDLIFVNKQMFY